MAKFSQKLMGKEVGSAALFKVLATTAVTGAR